MARTDSVEREVGLGDKNAELTVGPVQSGPILADIPTEMLQLNVDPTLHAQLVRTLRGATDRDALVDRLPLPRPPVRYILVGFVRLYRLLRPHSVGARCVFDPSCSRYAEVEFRTRGLAAFPTIVKRLRRCQGEHGGIDLPDGWGHLFPEAALDGPSDPPLLS